MSVKKNNKLEFTTRQIIDFYEKKDVDSINKLVKKSKIDLINQSLVEVDDPVVVLFFLMAINKNKTSSVYRYLPDELQNKIVEIATTNQIKIIFHDLFPDEILDIANRNKEQFKKILLGLSAHQRESIKLIDKFENDEAGSVMNPEFIYFFDNWTIKHCLNQYKKDFNKFEENTVFFVCNNKKRILGYVELKELIFANNYNKKISSILKDNFISVQSDDDIEKVIHIFQEYHVENVPVINKQEEIVGIINNNDILPAIEEETTEDIYNMYGIHKIEESYMKSSVLKIVKSRLLWVAIMMLAATATSVAISLFENWGVNVTAGLSTILLVPILPVITGTSGNTGSQAFATTVRAISVGDVTPKEYGKIIFKEFKIGLCLGLVLGFFNFARLCVYFAIPSFRTNSGNVLPYEQTLLVSFAASVALFLGVLSAKILGACLPIVATKFKLDPTIMCGPLIASFLDLISTTLLFLIGILFLQLII